MEVRLLPKDVAERARLDPRTMRYVLDNLGKIGAAYRLAIPAASRGEHRTLDWDQGIRLALCTRLKMLGLPIDVAGRTTFHCERYWRSITKGQPVTHLFDAHSGSPWRIALVNDRQFVQIERDRPDKRNNEESIQIGDYYRVGDWKRVTQLEVPPGLPKITWSLTHAAADLTRNAKAR